MGTRGLIRLCDEYGKIYAIVYSHWDSYPSGLGLILYKFLNGFNVSNGIGYKAASLYSVRKYTEFLDFLAKQRDADIRDVLIKATTLALEQAQKTANRFDDFPCESADTNMKQANGAGCLYAQLIAHLKVEMGSVYLQPADTDAKDQIMLEYVYEIKVTEGGGITIAIDDEGPLDLVAFEARCLRREDEASSEDDALIEKQFKLRSSSM